MGGEKERKGDIETKRQREIEREKMRQRDSETERQGNKRDTALYTFTMSLFVLPLDWHKYILRTMI